MGKEQLGGEVQSRSVCLGTLENAHYLFVAMADGSLYTYSIDPSTFALSNKKRVNLGTEPVTLTPLFIHDRFCIFASCDHPTVIHSSGRLTYNGVNMTDVAVMSPFHSEAFPDCFALASRSTLTIGTADDIQKLHYFTMPLGEQPRKIVHHPSSHAIVVATVGSEAVASGSGGAGGGEGENEEGKFGALGGTAGDGRRAYLRVLDDGAFDVSHNLNAFYPVSSVSLATDGILLHFGPLRGPDGVTQLHFEWQTLHCSWDKLCTR